MDATEIWLVIIITLVCFIGLGCIVYDMYSETETRNMIITQSEEYVTYNHCTKIQGKYYCKN